MRDLSAQGFARGVKRHVRAHIAHDDVVAGERNQKSNVEVARGAGEIHDLTGSYYWAFVLTIGLCFVSIGAIWIAGPRKVRVVPGRAPRLD